MKKTVYMMESFVTYINKGSVTLETDDFLEFKDKTDEEIGEMLRDGEYLVEFDGLTITTKELLEKQAKENAEEGEEDDPYIPDSTSLWDYHSESEVEFDKIKNETNYFLVQ